VHCLTSNDCSYYQYSNGLICQSKTSCVQCSSNDQCANNYGQGYICDSNGYCVSPGGCDPLGTCPSIIVNLIRPSNNFVSTSALVNFTLNVSGPFKTYYCDISPFWAINGVPNNTPVTAIFQLSNGNYNYYINCTNDSWSGVSQPYSLTQNAIDNLTIITPLNNSVIVTNTTNFNFTLLASDFESFNCGLEIFNDSRLSPIQRPINWTLIPVRNNTVSSTLINMSNWSNGLYYYYINCQSVDYWTSSNGLLIYEIIRTTPHNYYFTLNKGGTCTPSSSCSSLGYNCGTYVDSCGNSNFCGTCGNGYTCVNNHCVPSVGNNFDLCGGAGVVQNVNVNGIPFNVSDFSSAAIIDNSTIQNCNVFLNASNNNITIQNLNVNGTLLITGDNINILGNINATNIITVSNSTSSCLNFNGFINSFGSAEFVGENPNCTSYFNGTLIVNTTSSPPFNFNGNNYSIFFNFSGPLVFNGATVNSTTPYLNAGSAATASQITINNSNFFLTSSLQTVFNSSYPIIFKGNSMSPNMNFIPCVYSPDLTSSSTCIPLYLYGSLITRGGALQPTGSLFVNGVFDSNDNSLINSWPAGLTQEYDNVINTNGFLNVSIYIPTTTFNTIPYVGVQFSPFPTFDCSAGCVQYYIPVINQ